MAERPRISGIRFKPTDEDLVSYFLWNWIHNLSFDSTDIIKCEDVYARDPWNLNHQSHPLLPENNWYYLVNLNRADGCGNSDGNANRQLLLERETFSGWWEPKKRVKRVLSENGELLGFKKTLIFFRYTKEKGNREEAEKSNWKIHEYSLASDCSQDHVLCRIRYNGKRVDVGRGRSRPVEGTGWTDHHPVGNFGNQEQQKQEVELLDFDEDQNSGDVAGSSRLISDEFDGIRRDELSQPFNFEPTTEVAMTGNQKKQVGNQKKVTDEDEEDEHERQV